MSEPEEVQHDSRRPAAGPADSGPNPLPSHASQVPTGRPLPHSALPSPAPPPPAPAQRQANLPSKAPITAIGQLPARYLVRHGDGGFTRGLRTAAASGTQNLAPGFTNPSLFPTAQHRGGNDFRYAWRHFRYTLGVGIRKRGEARRENGSRLPQAEVSGASLVVARVNQPRLLHGSPGPAPQSQALGGGGEKFPITSLSVWDRTGSPDSSFSDTLRISES